VGYNAVQSVVLSCFLIEEHYAGFYIFTAVVMKSTILWDRLHGVVFFITTTARTSNPAVVYFSQYWVVMACSPEVA
jgi:hypothetical protein